MENLSRILQRLRPGSHYVIRGEEYSGIEWYDEVQIKPTLAEVEAEVTAVAALVTIDAIEEQYKITHRFSREMTGATVRALQIIAAKINALDAEIALLVSRAPDPIPTLDPPPYGAQVVAAVDAQIVTLRESVP